MKRLVWAMALLFAGCRRTPSDWETVKTWVRSEFPDVEQVSAEELKDSPRKPLLLDVRTEEEYRVSHLEGARRIDPDGTELPDFLRDLDRDHPIVTYCSVGYRSSALAERLAREGFTRVRNLEGSIFEWANKGYPVVRAGRSVREVHPYDEEWGRLLAPALRAFQPGGGSLE